MSSKYVEKIRILSDMCSGLMCRFALLKRTLSTPGGRPHALQNQDWQKIRRQLEHKFPDPGDLTKIPGYDSFRAHAATTTEELRPTFELFLDLLDCKEASLALLHEIPVDMMEIKININRNVLVAFLELLTKYAKLQLMWSSVEERKVLIAIYGTSFTFVNGSGDPMVSRLVTLLNSFEQPMRQMIDEFSQVASHIGDMLLQLGPSVHAARDPDALRQKNVFNPLEEGDGLALPANKPLAPQSDLSLYTELMNHDSYLDFIIWGCLICPSNLFRENVMELFKTPASTCIKVQVFREMNINLHQELETLANWYPAKNSNVQVPKGFKLKNVMKDLYKEAMLNSGIIHKERRSYLRGELANLGALLTSVPGLLAPKFPMIITALSMARAEIEWYFLHMSIAAGAKRTYKHVTAEHYEDSQIVILIGLVYDLIGTIRRNPRTVQQYYAEYLKQTDRTILQPLVQETHGQVQSFGAGVAQIFAEMTGLLDAIRVDDPESASMEGFRLNWDRAVTLFTAQRSTILRSDGFVAMNRRMHAAYQRSLYLDSLQGLVLRYAELWNIWWYQDEVHETFRRSLTDAEASAKHAASFLFVPGAAMANVHPDCPDEQPLLGEECGRIAEQLMTELSQAAESLVKPLWDHFQGLDYQIAPIEAAMRVERAQQHKQKGREQAAEPLPGYESHAWARDTIARLIAYQRNLANLLAGVNRVPVVLVFNRELHPPEHVKHRIASFFKAKLASIAFSDGQLERPSAFQYNLTHGCRAIQFALSKLDTDLQLFLREILYAELVDTTMPPPGSPVSPDLLQQDTVIHKIASWFVNAVQMICQEGSGIVWVESKRCFSRISNRTAFAAESFFELSELRCLTDIIGPQGVRVIDAALLKLACSKLAEVKRFLATNEGMLLEFKQKYMSGSWAEIAGRMRDSPAFIHNSVCLGVALVMRRLLHDALGQSQRLYAPFVQSTAAIAFNAVDARLNHEAALSLSCVGMDSGTLLHPDLSLLATLRHLNSNSDDHRLFDFLPCAYAAIFLSDYWKRSQFIPSMDAFSNNEHTIALALNYLLQAFHAREGNRTIIQKSAENYIEASAFVLLRMRSNERTEYRDFPLRSMFAMLEQFVYYCPDIDRGVLERYVPYAVLHASYVEVALGKPRALDTGHDNLMAAYAESNTESKLETA